jgi:citrate synthase
MPFGVESLPADIARVMRALPVLTEQLDAIAQSTSELPTMRAGIETVAEDTKALSGVENALGRLAIQMGEMKEELARVGAATDVLPPMDGRMAHIEESMPVLVEVQQHLSALPEVMNTIGTGLEQLSNLMDRLLASVEALDGTVDALRSSLEPIGRVADRFPGNRK